MSYRNTVISEYQYRYGQEEEVQKILAILNEYGNFKWHKTSQPYYGYFHGVIKDLDGQETRLQEKKITSEIKEKTGIRIVINYED